MRTRRRLRRRGVTDVPLELIIIMVILAIVIPIILAAFSSYTREQEVMTLSEQASNVKDMVIQVYDGGLNTTLILSVTVPSGGSLVIGGPLLTSSGLLNPDATWINYSISSGYGGQDLASSGAGEIYMTNITCSPIIFLYQALNVPVGTHNLAFTKLGPGASYCGVKMSKTFVEVALL